MPISRWLPLPSGTFPSPPSLPPLRHVYSPRNCKTRRVKHGLNFITKKRKKTCLEDTTSKKSMTRKNTLVCSCSASISYNLAIVYYDICFYGGGGGERGVLHVPPPVWWLLVVTCSTRCSPLIPARRPWAYLAIPTPSGHLGHLDAPPDAQEPPDFSLGFLRCHELERDLLWSKFGGIAGKM